MDSRTPEDRHEHAQDLFQQAYRAQMTGDWERAAELYKASLEILPTAEAHTFLGWTYHFQGKIEDAIDECKRAIEVDPDFGNPYNDIGAYLIEQGKWDEAIPWFQKAMIAPRYEARSYPHFNLGRVYEHRGNWTKAKECYAMAFALESRYGAALAGIRRMRAALN